MQLRVPIEVCFERNVQLPYTYGHYQQKNQHHMEEQSNLQTTTFEHKQIPFFVRCWKYTKISCTFHLPLGTVNNKIIEHIFVIYSIHIEKFKNNNQEMELYRQQLSQTYLKIIQACAEDQAVLTLKILQNKDYLFQRVEELFAEIFVEDRQNKIIELMEANKILSQQQTSNPPSSSLDHCESCQSMHRQMFALEKEKRELVKKMAQLTEFEEKESKQLNGLLMDENHELEKQIKNLENDLNARRSEWNSQKQELIKLNQSLRQRIRGQTEETASTISQLKLSLDSTLEQKIKLERQLYNYLEQRGQEQRELRDANSKTASLNLEKQKLGTELSLLRQENNLKEQKIKRIEQENDFLKESVATLEKENKQLRKKNIEIIEELNQTKAEKDVRADKNEKQSPLQLIAKYNQLQKINIQLDKKNTDLKQELSTKTAQMNHTSLEQQKTIIRLTDELRQNQAKHEKERRLLREEHKANAQKHQEIVEQQKQKEMASLVKKYEKLLLEKTKILDKLTDQNKELTKNLAKCQQTLSQNAYEYQEEKKQLSKLLQKQKQNNRQMKRYYTEGKVSGQIYEKQHSEKIKEVLQENSELMKGVESKEKEIRRYNQEVSNLTDEISNKNMMISSLRLKHQQSLKECATIENSLKSYKQNYKQKQRCLKQLKKSYDTLNEQKQELQNKVNKLIKSQKILEEKLKQREMELNDKKELIFNLQEQNKKQVLDIYEKTQQMTTQSKRQLQNYYISLLHNQEEKISYEEKRSLQKIKEEQIQMLQARAQQLQEKAKITKAKHVNETKEKEALEGKMAICAQQIQNLKFQNRKLIDQLRQQKQNNLHLIRSYQQKFIAYSNHFSEFKKQIYLSLKDQLAKVKKDLEAITKIVDNQLQKMKEMFLAFSSKMIQEAEKVDLDYRLALDRVRHEYEYGVVQKVEEEKRQAQLAFELKIKEQSMEFYTILAEKSHLISCLQTKQEKLHNKIGNLENNNDQLEKIARQATKKQEESKQVISKMNHKVLEAERTTNTLKNQTEYLKKQNIELKKELMNLENSFKQKIQKCRQNYISQNERLFTKYEKQLTKFVVPDRKDLEQSLLTHSKSSKNMLIPTKGCNNDDKLDHIQRQIEEQKKKLNLLESGFNDKHKITKTQKIGSSIYKKPDYLKKK